MTTTSPDTPTETAVEPPSREGRSRWISASILAVVFLVGLVVTHLLDTWAYHAGRSTHGRVDFEVLNLVRLFGYMPTWLLVAIAMTLIDRRINLHRSRWTHLFRAIPLLAATAFGGIMAETVKLLVRRQRPEYHDGAYGFRPFSDNPFNGSGLGMASSHTATAFAAAFMLSRMYPAASVVWYFIAAGTGLSRIVDGGHFLSDVWVGATLGLVAGHLVWGWHLKLNGEQLAEMGATERRSPQAAPGRTPSGVNVEATTGGTRQAIPCP